MNLSQGILWSKDVKKLDLDRDKVYIIHQVLAFGSLKEVRWLFRTFAKRQIVEVFVKYPQKVYSKSSFNFAKKMLLHLKTSLYEDEYIKALP